MRVSHGVTAEDGLSRLAGFFLERFRNRQGRRIDQISDEAMVVLRQYDWPGNIRELENAIEHAFALCSGQTIEVRHLPERIVSSASRPACQPKQFGGSSPEAVIQECLQRNQGDRAKTARELGMHRSTLWRKLREYGIGANRNMRLEQKRLPNRPFPVRASDDVSSGRLDGSGF